MSEQENTSPHDVQGVRVLKHRSRLPFTSLTTNGLTPVCASHGKPKISVSPVASHILHNTTSEARPAQPLLPEGGLHVILKDEATSSEYGVRRAPNGVYDLVLQGKVVGEQPQCRFTVLPKGEYIGVRCAAAKERYLQARKQGQQRLVFYSDHCGVWEQWKVVEWRQHAPAGEGVIKLSSRRLPGFTWSAKVIPADVSASGRPSSGDGATDADDANAEEGVLDLSRRLTAGFVHRLHLGPMPAVFATWRQLAVQAKKRMGQLRKCEQRWHRRWLQEGFARWRASAAALRRRRCLLLRASARHEGRHLRSAMSAWLQHTAYKRGLHRTEAVLRSAHMRRQLSSAFGAWRQHVEAERQLAAMCARIIAWRAHRRVRALFAAWASLTQREHLGRLADLDLLEALEEGQREPEDAPSAALTFPVQSKQRKSLSRLAMLKQPHPGQPAAQQDSDPANSAMLDPESTCCTESSHSRDSLEALQEVWHAALDVQPAEASPAVQLSGCWSEARPGMPSAVTRSQLRAPAWRPAGSAMPAQLQRLAPSTVSSAVPHAASPQIPSSHGDRGSPEAEGGGRQAISLACLESGTGMSPLARMPEVAASQAKLPYSRVLHEREETPFFTPVAALPKPEPQKAPCSSSAGTSRLKAASGCHSGLLQLGTPYAMTDKQSQSQTEASPDICGRSEHTLNPSSCSGSSSGAMSSREGGSSHQRLQKNASGQEDPHLAGSISIGPCEATHVEADPAQSSSSSRDSWETDMAECGSSGAHSLPSSTGCSSALDSLELQQTPPGQTGPEQALTPVPSSIGECATPDMAGHDPLPQAGDSISWPALALVQDIEASCRAVVQGRAYSPVHSLVDSSDASCHAANPPADSSTRDLIPKQKALPLGPADFAHSSPAQPVSALQDSSRGMQDSSSHETLMQDSVNYGSCPSPRAGNWVGNSPFWEAPAGALPGQATQRPLPCGPSISAPLGSFEGEKVYAEAQDPEIDSGAKGHRPSTFTSVAHDIAAGRSSSFAAWAGATASLAEDSLSPLTTPESAVAFESCEQNSAAPRQPALHQSVARDIAAGHSLSFAAWAAADSSPAQHSVSRLMLSMTPKSAAPLESCQQESPAARQPAGSYPVLHASGSMTEVAPLPVPAASAAADLHMLEDSARDCEAPHMSLGAVQDSHVGRGEHGISFGQQSLPTGSPCSMHAEPPGGADSMPCPPAQHETPDEATGAHTAAAMGSPAQQSPCVAGNGQQSYDALLAARQVFGKAQACYSPALALRSWDGSVRMPFTAWQHVTVMLWQRRLQTAAPLIRRRRFRALAWPFRAWAAQLDHSRCAASSHAAAEGGGPSLHVQQQEEQRRILHDSFWHWQEATVWGWKQRRDVLAAASAARLRRVLHAWRSLGAADEDAAVSAFRSAAGSARQIWAFQAWRAAAREQTAAAAAFQGVSLARVLTAVMRAWLEVVQSRAASRGIMQHVVRRRKTVMLAAALMHWRLLAERSQRVAAFSEKVSSSLAKRALSGWQQVAERSRELQAASQAMREAAAAIRAMRALTAWRSARSMSRAMSAFQHQHAVSLAKHALHAWRAHAAHATHLRSAAASLTALVAARLVRQALKALQQHASSCRSARELADRHAAVRSKRSLSKCLVSWRSQAVTSKQGAERAEHRHAQKLQRSLLEAWHAWREAVHRAAGQAEAAERHAAQRQVQILSTLIHAWRAHTELTLHRTATALLHCLDGRAWVMQQQIFIAWQALMQQLRAARAQAESLKEAKEAKLLSSIFMSWRQAASKAAEARAGAEVAVQLSSTQRAKRTVLIAWRNEAAKAGSASLRAEKMVQARHIRLAKQSFAQWQGLAQLMQAEMQAALMIHNARRSAQTLQFCLSAWRAHHMQQQAVTAAAKAHREGRESAVLHSIMRDWRQIVAAERLQRESAVQSFQVASQRQLLSSSLAQWQELQRSLQVARAEAEHRRKALQAGTLRAAFLTWRLISASMADSQQLSCQSVSRAFSVRKLRALLQAWAATCRAARGARQAAHDLANQAHLRSVQRAFSGWRAANASLQHQRSSLLSLCIELARERRLSAAFAAWHGAARSGQRTLVEARCLEAQYARRKLRQAFAAWRIANAALAHQQHSAAEQMLAARGQRAQQGAFLAWRQHASHMRSVCETAKAMGLAQQKRRQMERLSRVLGYWRLSARMSAERELAEASLTRQIILARAFLGWAAVAQDSFKQEPARFSESQGRSAALAESVHALQVQRTAYFEELRGFPAVVDQSRHLQDELEDLQSRVHKVQLCTWQLMLPAPTTRQSPFMISDSSLPC